MPRLSPLPWEDLEGAQQLFCPWLETWLSLFLFLRGRSGPQQQGWVPAGAGVDQKGPPRNPHPPWNVNQAPASAANSLPFGKLKK